MHYDHHKQLDHRHSNTVKNINNKISANAKFKLSKYIKLWLNSFSIPYTKLDSWPIK